MFIAFVFALVSIVHAAPEASPAAIEQAQKLALKKDRQHACATLIKALQDTQTPAKAARARLSETLAQISTVFFTDKGQRAFEAGQSMMFDTPDLALSQFREALQYEDMNLSVLNSMAKVALLKQDCDGALGFIQKARTLNPYAGESAVLELRALSCQKNATVFAERLKTLPSLDKWEEQFVSFLSAQDQLQAKAPRKAFEALQKLAEEQPAFPETYRWLARAGQEMDKDGEVWLQKYVSLCKAVTAKERKRYSLEPRLCAQMKEAEDELAKTATDI